MTYKNDMQFSWTEILLFVKVHGFLSFAGNVGKNIGKIIGKFK